MNHNGKNNKLGDSFLESPSTKKHFLHFLKAGNFYKEDKVLSTPQPHFKIEYVEGSTLEEAIHQKK